MIVSRVVLKNWRNFKEVDVALGYRAFLVGPNASGKSNFLDVFRFLRDIVKPGGGFKKAVSDRGGISKIRCLAARKNPDIAIKLFFSDVVGGETTWIYDLAIKQTPRGHREVRIKHERVWRGGQPVLNRPSEEDSRDPLRLTQTHLEQINANQHFRPLYEFFGSVSYLHLVPQLLRYPEAFTSYDIPGDPFGKNLIKQIAATPQRTRTARLKRIEAALKAAVPQFEHLTYEQDERGVSHLQAEYIHWRAQAAKQREDQFSDGTLRLIGLLWALLESDSLMLLEEPELSLHAGLVRQIPQLMHRLQTKNKRQVLVSTHSYDLLSEPGIAPEEVLLLKPDSEGTIVKVVAQHQEIMSLLKAGLSIADAALPYGAPGNAEQLAFL